MTTDFLDRFEFFTGVPDSLLKALCDRLMDKYGIGDRHIIAANEGNAVALAAGYHLATGKVPVVYLQNSGIGNIINPVASLLNEKVYAIPCLFVVGWRGEPGVNDEPQHVFQGEVTLKLLRDMDIDLMVIDDTTTENDVNKMLDRWNSRFAEGKQAAFVVKKGAFTYEHKMIYQNTNKMCREKIIRTITDFAGDDVIVSTTGKASRELFEIRESANSGHERDFLTVGSMGHSSSLALGIALHKPDSTVWILDGDGAMLMHMGSLAVLGANNPKNCIHILLNNGAHETVGGMPTATGRTDFVAVAKACGYPFAVRATNESELSSALAAAKAQHTLCFIEATATIGSRADLGRPTTTAKHNKEALMTFLND